MIFYFTTNDAQFTMHNSQFTMHDAQSRTEVYLLTERHKGHILDRRAGGREEFGGLKVDFGVLALNIGGFLS